MGSNPMYGSGIDEVAFSWSYCHRVLITSVRSVRYAWVSLTKDAGGGWASTVAISPKQFFKIRV